MASHGHRVQFTELKVMHQIRSASLKKKEKNAQQLAEEVEGDCSASDIIATQ
jgi:hypothetical protein